MADTVCPDPHRRPTILFDRRLTTPQEERKPRKSVAFSEDTTIVDGDGQVTESVETNGGKSSAESHGLPAGQSPHYASNMTDVCRRGQGG
jgi:hypothetical protein